MNIIVLNGLRFVAPLRALGHQVRSFGELKGCDHQLVVAKQTIDHVLELADFRPDLILVEVFGGAAPFFRGLELCPYPLAVYAVDSSINLFWMRHYLALFDIIFVDQADAARQLHRSGIRATWLPLAIDPANYALAAPPVRSPQYEIVFVGRVTPNRGKRHNFIQLLQNHFPVHVVGKKGDPWLSETEMARIFAKSKIVLNENLFNGVTLRVFQGLASGAMLLTEQTTNGLYELFENGKHLVAFTPKNLLEKVRYYLSHEEERQTIALTGQNEVLKNHTLERRAETILEKCSSLSGRSLTRPRGYRLASAAGAYALLAERFNEQAPLFLARAEKSALAAINSADATRRVKAHALEYLGRCLITGLHERDALSPLFEAMRLAPRNPTPCFFLGHLLLRLGQEQNAVSFFQNGLKRLEYEHTANVAQAGELTAAGQFHSPEIWLAYAKVMTECAKQFEPGFIKKAETAIPETAVEYYQLAAHVGGDIEAYTGLAGCYEQAGIWDLAYEHLLKALECNPTGKGLLARCSRAHALCYSPCDPLLRREKAQLLQEIRIRG